MGIYTHLNRTTQYVTDCLSNNLSAAHTHERFRYLCKTNIEFSYHSQHNTSSMRPARRESAWVLTASAMWCATKLKWVKKYSEWSYLKLEVTFARKRNEPKCGITLGKVCGRLQMCILRFCVRVDDVNADISNRKDVLIVYSLNNKNCFSIYSELKRTRAKWEMDFVLQTIFITYIVYTCKTDPENRAV